MSSDDPRIDYRPLSFWWPGVPISNNGSPRPLLNAPLGTMTAHYTGNVKQQYGALDTDAEYRDFMTKLQNYAMGAGKSFEYNYVLFMTGVLVEYAGDHRAAHSEGENDIAIGVMFVNDTDDLCTDAQVLAYQWLRDVHLKGRGRVIATCVTTPHRAMPGANTGCPGDAAIMPRLADLRAPYVPYVPPTPNQEDDVKLQLLQDTRGVWVTGDFVFYRAVSPSDITLLAQMGLVDLVGPNAKVTVVGDDVLTRMTNATPPFPKPITVPPAVVDNAAIARAVNDDAARRLQA